MAPEQAVRRCVRAAARHFGVAEGCVRAPEGRSARHVRAVAIYAARTVFGLPISAVARQMGVGEATVVRRVLEIEDRREDFGFDGRMAAIEEDLMGVS